MDVDASCTLYLYKTGEHLLLSPYNNWIIFFHSYFSLITFQAYDLLVVLS